MSIENPHRSPESNRVPPIAPTLAARFDYASVTAMAQRESIPHMARVLGVGATMAVLGQELAFYRSDIHWINVASSYDDPEIAVIADQPTDDNIEYHTWDLQSLNDIYPAEHFDRIYYYNDPPELDSNTASSLLDLVKSGGQLHAARVKRNFIQSASYRESIKLLIVQKPSYNMRPNSHEVTLPQTNITPSAGTLSSNTKEILTSKGLLAAVGTGIALAALIGTIYNHDATSKVRRRK